MIILKKIESNRFSDKKKKEDACGEQQTDNNNNRNAFFAVHLAVRNVDSILYIFSLVTVIINEEKLTLMKIDYQFVEYWYKFFFFFSFQVNI